MTSLAWAISRALIDFVWQGSIVGISLWGVLFLLKKKSANSRYVASCVALAVLAVMPVVTAAVVYRSSAAPAAGMALSVPSQAAGLSSLARITQSVWWTRLQSWTLPVWSLGVLMFSLRLVMGYQHAFQLQRRGKPAGTGVRDAVQRVQGAMGVNRRIRVLISAMTDSPSVVGSIRPVILLPAATFMGLTPLQLEAILAHEIGHIRRHDYLVNLMQMVIETVLFYHPAVWWASKRIRVERELCCDDLAVRFSGNALRYARALTTLEKLRLRTPQVAMASTGGPLLYRIHRLVGVPAKEYGGSRFPMLLAAALALMCVTFNVLWVRAQDAPGVTVDLGAAAVVHRAPVQYPEAAQKQGITGAVQVEVKLDSTGNVADAKVLTGPEELRKAALESVLKWHFTSDAARSSRLITIQFSDQGTQVQVREPRVEKLRTENFVVTRGQELEREMEALKVKIRAANGVQAGDERQREMKQLELKLAATRLENTRRVAIGSPFAGRSLREIGTPGMADSARNELISRLPIHEGDTLSPSLLEQTSQAVRTYDEHLRVQFIVSGEDGAILRVTAADQK